MNELKTKELQAGQFSHREEAFYKSYRNSNRTMPVNEQQHSFDTTERQEAFVKAQYPTEEQLQRYYDYRKEWYRRPKEFDAGLFPLAVGIELVSSCNLNCPMCYTITEEFQSSVIGSQRMMPWETVTALVDECAELGVYSILFSWRGESTLYRSRHDGREYGFADALAYARSKGIMEVSCLTNGQIIDREMAEAIVEAEPNWINISIDGLGETYNKIRTPRAKRSTDYNAFRVITENIERLVAIRDSKGKTRPQLRSNTIFPTIAEGPDEYFNFMKEIGIGWVTVNEILDFRGSGTDGEELPEDAIVRDWACQYPFQRLMVSANGTIVPCTGAHNEESSLALGRYKGSSPKVIKNADGSSRQVDIPEVTLHQAWHCDKVKKIRQIHKQGQRVGIKGCKNCRHGAVKHGVTWMPSDWDTDSMEWTGHKFRNG
ncbi:MAG: radical SAM protein [Planctomycetes bacterium]|nr:radical SAM protein [Planctomycetota bacterium]